MSGTKPTHSYLTPEQQQHKDDLNNFGAELQKAIRRAIPEVGYYRTVAVLSITWSNDDMGVEKTETELLRVLEKVYGFNVKKVLIDASLTSDNATISLKKQIDRFANKWGNSGCLLIYIYSGHAAVEESEYGGRDEYRIGGQAKNNRLVGPSIDWFSLTSFNRSLPADVLYIIDSCYAGNLGLGDGPELLAAANWESVAGDQLDTSFTSILTKALESLAGEPCSVASLFAKIHREGSDNKLEAVPLHVQHAAKNSIILQRPQNQNKSQTKPQTNLQTGPQTRSKSQQIGPLQKAESRVLISVHLKDGEGIPKVQEWKNWLTSRMPPFVDVSQISIEGQFDAGSSLILVAIPIEVWTQLPTDDTAYGFVAYVRSGNRLLQQPAALAYRGPLPGRENQSPRSQGGPGSKGPFGGSGSGSGSQHQRGQSDGRLTGSGSGWQ